MGGSYNPETGRRQRGMKVKSSEREERLAAALRENLKRRKSRTRMLKKPPAHEPATDRPNKAAKPG